MQCPAQELGDTSNIDIDPHFVAPACPERIHEGRLAGSLL